MKQSPGDKEIGFGFANARSTTKADDVERTVARCSPIGTSTPPPTRFLRDAVERTRISSHVPMRTQKLQFPRGRQSEISWLRKTANSRR